MPLNKTTDLLLSLPRAVKRVIALAFDAALCALAVWFAFYLRLDEWVTLVPGRGEATWQPHWALLTSWLLALPIFVVSGFYRAIFRYAGWQASLNVARALMIYGVLYAAVFTAIGVPGVPRSIGILQPMLLFLLVAGSRLYLRFWLGGLYRDILARSALPKALIYGAGNAGRQLSAALDHSHELRVIGYLDDDVHLHGHLINGLPVHAPEDLPALVESLGVRQVLVAIPSLNRQRRKAILERLRFAHVAVRLLPAVTELAQGKVAISDLHEPEIEDLLGREPVAPDPALLEKNIRGRVVLVTGAGGSIGSELCRQILAVGPAALILLEISEFALYTIYQELLPRAQSAGVELVPLLGSVTDVRRMRAIMSVLRPATIYHAAAYKHVPLVEHNPIEGIGNNVFGTLTTAHIAQEVGVADFVLISTDKAVRPTNVMGASKRLAEMILQALAAEGSSTRFTMVRFGNVLASSGSVVPLFRRQIKDGGPVTLTHPEVTRYFMTIPEAAQLVIQAGAMGMGGEVFLLDMGEPVKIADLARRMIELSGLTVRDEENPDGDIEIQITGLRPGEKLYEELLIGEDPQSTPHPRIWKAKEAFLCWEILESQLAALEKAMNVHDLVGIRQMMQQLVSGYQPNGEDVDWLHLARKAGTRNQEMFAASSCV